MAIASALVLSAVAVRADLSSSETERVKRAAAVVGELRAAPDSGIPEDLWSRAQCVAVIPGVKKAAFVFGGEYGKGVLSCRNNASWNAPVFLQLKKGSFGLQIGGQQADLVLLIMNRRGAEKLLGDKVSLGADASVAAGPVGRAASAQTDARLTAEILAYSRAKGAFAGIDLSGGVLSPDHDANVHAYGKSTTPRQVVLAGGVPVPAAARPFIRALGQEPQATTGKKK